MINPLTAYQFIRDHAGDFKPKIGLILGSGLNNFAEQLQASIIIPYRDIPGFSECSVEGHKGSMLLGKLGDVPIVCLQGRAHYYEGNSHCAIQIPIRVLKLLGCETLILTNAAASLRREVAPGSLVLISDHINFQFMNPLVGPNDAQFGPRFPTLQDAYDKNLIDLSLKAARDLSLDVKTGIYLATLGPSYETPAEIRAFKILGADIVGMSTVAEAIVARHCNMKVLAISTICNMACGMCDEYLTHEAVLEVAKHATSDLTRLLLQVISRISVPLVKETV